MLHLCCGHFFGSPNAGVTSVASASITTARSLIHCSSVIGLSLMMYLPVTCSTCQASRQRLVSVLHPEDLRRDVGQHVLDDRHARHLAVLVAEDLLGLE